MKIIRKVNKFVYELFFFLLFSHTRSADMVPLRCVLFQCDVTQFESLARFISFTTSCIDHTVSHF